MYVWSYVWGHHAVGGSSSQFPSPAGSYSNGADRYDVEGLMPSAIAAASTNVLNVEPACRRASDARLNWLPFFPGVTATIALMRPFAGSIATSAAAGSSRYGNVSTIAFR